MKTLENTFQKNIQFDKATVRALRSISIACLDDDTDIPASDLTDSALTRRAVQFVAEQMAAGRLTPKRFLGTNGS